MPKRKKAKSYSALKREADKVFSEWIRRNAAAEYAKWGGDGDTARCATCQTPYSWKVLQCGHFVSRVHLATRWDERNCAPQCYACNVLRRGNPAEFALYLMARYAGEIIAELADKKRQTVKYTRSDLQELIDTYKQKLKELDA